MDAHRVEVLDRADDDHVVGAVPDHLELELVPSAHGLLDEHLADRGLGQSPLHLGEQRSRIVREATAVPAQRERRAHHGRDGEAVDLVESRHDDRGRDAETARLDRVLELLAVLRAPDHLHGRADELDAELLEHTRLRERDREVERGLPAERRQDGIRALALEDGGDALEVERLDVRAVGEPGVGHDRRRVRVDDDRAIAVLAQHLQRLAARVVELAGLADDDRAGADDADALEVAPRRHQLFESSSTQRSRIGHASCGPGPASGWNCTERARSAGKSKPSTVPS